MRICLIIGVLFATALPAHAGDSPAVAAHRDALAALAKREADFWKEFEERIRAVYVAWEKPVPEAEKLAKDGPFELSLLRRLYEDFEAIETAKAEADLALATAGPEGAAGRILEVLRDVAAEVDALDARLADAVPVEHGWRYDQSDPVRRHGIQRRLDGLVEAFERLEPADWIEATFKEASKGDGKASTSRRAVLLDALARRPRESVRPFVEKLATGSTPFLRIQSAEVLLRLTAQREPVVSKLLADPNPAVRRAVLRAVRSAPGALRYAPDLVPLVGRSDGLYRAQVVDALESLSGEAFGFEVERWKAWLVANRPQIEDGTYTRPGLTAFLTTKTADPVRFYGVPSLSLRPIFVLDGTLSTGLPADADVQAGRSRLSWSQQRRKWKEEHESHKEVMAREMVRMLETMPADARWAAILSFGFAPDRFGIRGDRRRLKPDAAARKQVLDLIRKRNPQGIRSCYEGVVRAFAISGADPLRDPRGNEVPLDTIYLLDSGWNGGRYAIPEACVAAIGRANRFRAIVIHGIRISHRVPAEESERLLKGIAEQSGGTYHFARKPPE